MSIIPRDRRGAIGQGFPVAAFLLPLVSVPLA
jgi:hypothetical protein